MSAESGRRYRGRFAPSPTGPLHFGSLVAALGAFADARHHGGEWLVRIEDVDRNRSMPGADADILAALEAFGMWWDGPVLYQSQRGAVYEAVLERLRTAGRCYPCACTRREIIAEGSPGAEGPVYAGTCRDGLRPGRPPRSERVRVDCEEIAVDDRIQGRITQQLANEVGDFLLRRADGFYAYQLAVVIDDAAQQIDQIVRGADLFGSTPRQIYLQQLLGFPQPQYAHLPVVLDDAGQKLSKSTAALPVDSADPVPTLLRAWRFLGQEPLTETCSNVDDFWQQAIPRWKVERVPRQHGLNTRSPLGPAVGLEQNERSES
jgi:glutamyl-Q tRNA(Asp) synthetase